MEQKWTHDDYKVAWICPLEVEQIAALQMLDKTHPVLPQSPADHNMYKLGSINGHNIVVSGLYLPGNCAAATVVTQMKMTFPKLRFGLLIGIGGGVPVETDNGMIRLGHVVVSKPAAGYSGALQYNHGKGRDNHFERTGCLAPPPATLLNAAQALAVERAGLEIDPVHQNVSRIDTKLRGLQRFKYPGANNDHLYPPDYAHKTQGAPCTTECDPSRRITRASDDDETYVIVHRGNIASGELVVKDAWLRDALAEQHDLLCFEMEAAGAIADFPFLIIRGISDYCDSHKNDEWQGYAAAVAAAYARQLFFHLPVDEVQRHSDSAPIHRLTFKLPAVKSVNNFVARQAELGRIHEALKGTGDRRIVVLHGLGGMGKTQTAIEYAKQHQNEYSAVIWLDASNATVLKQSYQRVAQQIASEIAFITYIQNAVNNRDLDKMVVAVKQWLSERENHGWLVIYDNYDDVDLRIRDSSKKTVRFVVAEHEDDAGETVSKAYDIRRYFPETEHGAILITTRSSSVGRLGHDIRLKKLDDIQDSLRILASTSRRVDFAKEPDANLLAQQLDGLPLALATAGAYINQVSIKCTEYVQIYHEKWLQVQEQSPPLLEYGRALHSTWGTSLEHVQRQNQHAVNLLHLWAYFDNYDLWYELLQAGNACGPDWLRQMTKDRFCFDAAMGILCEYGLADPISDDQGLGPDSIGYTLHACVHSWTVHVLNEESSEVLATTAIQCIASRIPHSGDPEFSLVQRRVLSHADRLVAKIERDFNVTPSVLRKLGNFYQEQGQLPKASSMFEHALRGLEKAPKLEQTSRAMILHKLGLLYFDQGLLKDAGTRLEQARKDFEAGLGLHHINTLTVLNDLGSLYYQRGHLEDAEKSYEWSLQGYETLLGPDHSLTLASVYSLGLLYIERQKLQEAKRMFARALRCLERNLGPEHLLTLSSAHNLGLLYVEMGQLQAAKEMYKRALRGFQKASGPDHPRVLRCVQRLADIYKDQGQLQESKKRCKWVLEGCSRMPKPDVDISVRALETLQALAYLFVEQGEVLEAIICYKQAKEGPSSLFGAQSELCTTICGRLSSLQSSMGELSIPPGIAETKDCKEINTKAKEQAPEDT